MRIDTSWKLKSDGNNYPGEAKSVIVEAANVNNAENTEVFLSLSTTPGYVGTTYCYLNLEQAIQLRDNLDSIIAKMETEGK